MIDMDEMASDLLTLLDDIEISEDSKLASKRFEIAEKYGLTVVIDDVPITVN